MRAVMRVGRRGKDLAVRIPKALVRELGLKESDEVDLTILGLRQLGIAPRREPPLSD
jgi:antitoxin component of MazEF toxin-antitoxin module